MISSSCRPVSPTHGPEPVRAHKPPSALSVVAGIALVCLILAPPAVAVTAAVDSEAVQTPPDAAASEPSTNAPADVSPPEAETGESTVSMGPSGLSIESADGRYGFAFRGYFMVDGRAFVDGIGEDEVTMRRIRPSFRFRFGDFRVRLTTGFDGGDSAEVVDGWLAYEGFDGFDLRIGRFKVPFGLERIRSASQILLPERSLVDNLVPDRDLGIVAEGETGSGRLDWSLALLDGVEDRGFGSGDGGDGLTGVGRVMVRPVASGTLENLSVGIGATYGKRSEDDALGTWRTPGLERILEYRSGASPTGRHLRVSPQAELYAGRLTVMAEAVLSSLDVTVGPVEDTLVHRGGQVAFGWVLTGEDTTPRGVRPEHPFEPGSGHWGAWELTGRYSVAEADEDAFPLFIDPARSVQRADNLGLGLRWFLNTNVRVLLAVDHVSFDGGAPGGRDREDETSATARLQLAF